MRTVKFNAGPLPDWWHHPLADKVIEFLSGLTLVGDYAGEPWKLEPFQESWIRELYGRRNPDGTRQISTVSLWWPRGAGKTQQAAGIVLYQLVCGPPGQEIYAVAADQDKANRTHYALSEMIKHDPWLSKLLHVTQVPKRVANLQTGSTFHSLACDSDVGHGLSPSMLVLDELHLWKNRRLYDNLIHGFRKRKKGTKLEIQISTAGDSKHTLAWDMFSYTKDVLEGKVTNPNMLVRISQADPEDDWTSIDTWKKACPASFINWEETAQECEYAKRFKYKEAEFRRYILNQWVEGSENSWIAQFEWMACYDDYTEEDLIGEPCVAAYDLSRVRDMTALALFFPESGRVLVWAWLPGEDLTERAKRDQGNYQQWVKDGSLMLCDGPCISFEQVARQSNEILSRHNVTKVVADPCNLLLIAPHLDLEPETYSQNITWISPPFKWLESALFEGKIRHNAKDTDLLTWCVGNVAVRIDPLENIAPDKRKSRARIDPVVALVMAIGAHIGNNGPDVNRFYADPGNWRLEINPKAD